MNFNPFALFSRKTRQEAEKKSVSSSGWENYGLYDFVNGCNGYEAITAKLLWSYYKKINPLRHAIEGLISPNFANIEPVIYDKEEEMYLTKKEAIKSGFGDLLDLLENPNFDCTGAEQRSKAPASYRVIGDLYFIVKSMDETSSPIDLFYVAPQSVSPLKGTDGYVQSYSTSSDRWNEIFTRQKLADGKVSFFSQDGTKELWHIRTFNPDVDAITGLSPISSSVIEMEQYEVANTHNNNYIKQGARPSGVLTIPADVDLSLEQEQALKQKLTSYNANNAGDVLIVQGGQNFQEMSTSNKDMDYIEMMKRVTKEVYNNNNIPLPLVESGTMTLNNYAESKVMLYDMSILPFADMYYGEMTRLLMRRFDDSGRYCISYNEENIKALQVLRDVVNKMRLDSDSLTVDEKRTILGYDTIKGGNVILKPMNLVPLGFELEETGSEKFRKALIETKKYSQDEVNEKVKLAYG
jgi:HK97 family phage portal protein